MMACTILVGFSADSTDCNDSPFDGALINPSMAESCNTQDDDCDGLTDEEVQTIFYADADGDGFGDATTILLACILPAGFVNDNTDCDDNIATGSVVFPGAPETCNYMDDNCNTVIDEELKLYFMKMQTMTHMEMKRLLRWHAFRLPALSQTIWIVTTV